MKKTKKSTAVKTKENDKTLLLGDYVETSLDATLTTNQGLKINDDQNSLKAGVRGSTLLEDFQLREKITHFDHERIPERVVHARGAGAHGVFQVYESMKAITQAKFLQDKVTKTPVFVRFSTVGGSRGSTDLARDVRGFSVKFYTDEGNYDLVGNNMPVFFIQDAVKFPDLVHAVKPEPNNEIPQASSAHDTFWDFISLMPESMHMIMWVMSDRAIPRSFRMMEGFGVHTFRFVNEKGKSSFVKFHWKPLLGVHSVVWDEAQKISGMDPDFHRRDLWESIENGDFPEWELAVQIVNEEDEHNFDFDLLDPTKLIPEELVPLRRIGKMTLNRNPENFFAETEQVAFHPGHVVPGIDFSNDPLLQGRLFSYTDTQLLRLGGPNFHEIPINQPIIPVHNNQRDGHMRQTINSGEVNYHPNSIGGGCPMQAGQMAGGYVSHATKMESPKVRARSEKFFDHFNQAAMFFNSQTDTEKDHIIQALRFELGKVKRVEIRERMVGLLVEVDKPLAKKVADGLGIAVPSKPSQPMNQSIPADGNPKDFQPTTVKKPVTDSPKLSIIKNLIPGIKSRKVAILASNGVHAEQLAAIKRDLTAKGALAVIISPRLGYILDSKEAEVKVDFSLLTVGSVLFDAIFVVSGEQSINELLSHPKTAPFIEDAYLHCKAIGAVGNGVDIFPSSLLEDEALTKEGIITGDQMTKVSADFIKAMSQHRAWSREKKDPS